MASSLLGVKAQNFGKINAMLDRLEERRGLNQNLDDVAIDGKTFILIKDFDDHTERQIITFKKDKVNYIEVFDDKSNQTSSSNIFDGDMVRVKNGQNIISIRADQLEGKKIPLPLTKTLVLNKQKGILYLIDINTKERWIDATALNNKSIKNKN